MKITNYVVDYSDPASVQAERDRLEALEGSGSGGSNSGGNWFSNLWSNVGGILSGAGNLAAGIKGNTNNQPGAVTNNYQQEKSNTGLYIGLAVGAVAIIGLTHFANQ